MSPQTELLKGIAELDNSGHVIAGEDCVTSARGLFSWQVMSERNIKTSNNSAADGAMAVTQWCTVPR